jgi:hypothetical protein
MNSVFKLLGFLQCTTTILLVQAKVTVILAASRLLLLPGIAAAVVVVHYLVEFLRRFISVVVNIRDFPLFLKFLKFFTGWSEAWETATSIIII